MEKQGYVYILTNEHNSVLYTGITSNLPKRMHEHKNGLYKGFSQKYSLKKLVYCEQYQLVKDAIDREKYIKGKKRQFKCELINSLNPNWDDLSNNMDF